MTGSNPNEKENSSHENVEEESPNEYMMDENKDFSNFYPQTQEDNGQSNNSELSQQSTEFEENKKDEQIKSFNFKLNFIKKRLIKKTKKGKKLLSSKFLVKKIHKKRIVRRTKSQIIRKASRKQLMENTKGIDVGRNNSHDLVILIDGEESKTTQNYKFYKEDKKLSKSEMDNFQNYYAPSLESIMTILENSKPNDDDDDRLKSENIIKDISSNHMKSNRRGEDSLNEAYNFTFSMIGNWSNDTLDLLDTNEKTMNIYSN